MKINNIFDYCFPARDRMSKELINEIKDYNKMILEEAIEGIKEVEKKI